MVACSSYVLELEIENCRYLTQGPYDTRAPFLSAVGGGGGHSTGYRRRLQVTWTRPCRNRRSERGQRLDPRSSSLF